MTETLAVAGGVGGLSAALVPARSRRRARIVDSETPHTAPAAGVHGFRTQDGTPPAELRAVGREEADHYGGRVLTEQVRAVRPLADGTVVPVAAAFVPPRFVPNRALRTGLSALNDNGWARVESTGRTSVPGVWAVGTVVDPTARGVTVAVAGTKAEAAVNMDRVEEECVERVR